MPLKPSLYLIISTILLVGGCQPKSETKSSFDAEKHFKAKCSICHENVEMQRGPNIFGLNEEYLTYQMQAFKSGIRGKNPKNKSAALMASAIVSLPPEEHFSHLAKWIANQSAPSKVYNLKGDAKAGEAMAQACLACHSQKGEFAVPDLLTLEPWYMLGQLRKFKSELRGSHPEDRAGQLMKATVSTFKDRDLKKIVLYLQGLMKEKSK